MLMLHEWGDCDKKKTAGVKQFKWSSWKHWSYWSLSRCVVEVHVVVQVQPTDKIFGEVMNYPSSETWLQSQTIIVGIMICEMGTIGSPLGFPTDSLKKRKTWL